MIQEEQDLGVDAVHGWFTEGGDSILGIFLCEPERRYKATNNFLDEI